MSISTPDPQRSPQPVKQAHNAVVSLGAEKLTMLAGGIVGGVGTLLPFYSGEYLLTGVVSYSMVQWGVGWLVLLAAIVLGALPLVTTMTRGLAIAGFGLSTGVLGIILADRTVFGQTASIDFGAGFYFAVVGFLVLALAYVRRAYEA